MRQTSAHSSARTGWTDSRIEVTDKNTARKILNLMEALDDHEDVQNVFTNFDMADGLLDDE